MENKGIDFASLLKSLKITETEKIEPELITLALSHKSARAEDKKVQNDNERLEYLGDAVLKLSVSQWLYLNYPEASEGVMSQVRAYVVSDKTLARVSRKISLGNYILLGKKERFSGGSDKDSILANVLEAIFGIVFLSLGFEKTAPIIINLISDELEKAVEGDAEKENTKDLLQKITQAKFKNLPTYNTVHVEGPPHRAIFQCHLLVQEKEYFSRGNSKKEAEQKAAKIAIEDLQDG